ncbi:MAG: hypothetical protein ABII01_02325 [Candidatus Woesearchaeota archaeon]
MEQSLDDTLCDLAKAILESIDGYLEKKRLTPDRIFRRYGARVVTPELGLTHYLRKSDLAEKRDYVGIKSIYIATPENPGFEILIYNREKRLPFCYWLRTRWPSSFRRMIKKKGINRFPTINRWFTAENSRGITTGFIDLKPWDQGAVRYCRNSEGYIEFFEYKKKIGCW